MEVPKEGLDGRLLAREVIAVVCTEQGVGLDDLQVPFPLYGKRHEHL